jgi:hypothetical protein
MSREGSNPNAQAQQASITARQMIASARDFSIKTDILAQSQRGNAGKFKVAEEGTLGVI